jgi:hypothetical protein
MNMEIDMDKGMAMDTEIQRFRCRISDIGEKFNPVSHIMSGFTVFCPISEVLI